MYLTRLFDDVREATWTVLALSTLAVFGLWLLVPAAGAQEPVREGFRSLESATAGLLQPTLILAWLNILGIVGLVIFGCRGFFLPQFYLKASRRMRKESALVVALIGSQVLFALPHLHPNRLLALDVT